MSPKDILIDEYDYRLPDERIAKKPLSKRDACKLLVWRDGAISESVFADLPELLPSDSTLIYNNTRVINARLRFKKSTGASIEIFCLEPVEPSDYALNFASCGTCEWLCFVGNLKRWKEGILEMPLTLDGSHIVLKAERIGSRGNAWIVRFSWDGNASFSQIIDAAGEIPVPPYLNRPTEESDNEDYQTVYSHIEGSVAAPTAGLHFTPAVLEKITERGIQRLEVTLHVGAGTFQPVKSDAIGDHPMHSEFISVDIDTIVRIRESIVKGRQIIAVGTTSVRTLESLYHAACLINEGKWNGEVPQWYPYEENHPDLGTAQAMEILLEYMRANNSNSFIADTKIIIAPGYKYRVVKGMVTNFHQPRSTLLLLVSAFTGENNWRRIYDYALSHDFRFLSYGDACLLLR